MVSNMDTDNIILNNIDQLMSCIDTLQYENDKKTELIKKIQHDHQLLHQKLNDVNAYFEGDIWELDDQRKCNQRRSGEHFTMLLDVVDEVNKLKRK